ncbi:MAG: protein-disulfide reductase DsbD family protein, partial [Marinirhabdus sp.]|nr:protein-disulfide reductase DsbD family protein [Marinirhabdus sp.]
MKKYFVSSIFLVFSFVSLWAQDDGIFDPVTWDVSLDKQSDTEYNVLLKATIDEGWHLYSQTQFGEEFEGPIRTEITYNNSPETFTLLGETQEPDVPVVFDPVFELDVKFFEDQAMFIQPIKVINPEGLKIQVEVYYSVCDDEKCLPPDTKTFELDLASGSAKKSTAEITQEDLEKSAALTIEVKGQDVYKDDSESSEKSFLTIFLLGFVGGLIALLTPCVFPMIPLTVSFFTKSAQNKQKGLANAILYGLFIFLIYVLLSIPFHLLDSLDPEILNNISTNVTLNIIFFVIFIVFAFSFFGYYEIT